MSLDHVETFAKLKEEDAMDGNGSMMQKVANLILFEKPANVSTELKEMCAMARLNLYFFDDLVQEGFTLMQ